jgi:hypothetical protein
VDTWPTFPRPASVGDVTVFDVAMTDTPQECAEAIQRWGRSVWQAWSHVHDQVRELTDRQLEGWHPH